MLNVEKQGKLQSMQNRFLRLVYRNVELPTRELYLQMGIEKLSPRRDLHLCGQIYRRSRREEYIDTRDLPTRQFDKIVLRFQIYH